MGNVKENIIPQKEVSSNEDVMSKNEIIHFRPINEDGSIDPRGGVTICYLVDGDKAFFGMSICSTLDNYERKRGANAARGKATSSKEKNIEEHSSHLLTRDELFEVVRNVAEKAWKIVCERHGRPVKPLDIPSKKHRLVEA